MTTVEKTVILDKTDLHESAKSLEPRELDIYDFKISIDDINKSDNIIFVIEGSIYFFKIRKASSLKIHLAKF